ncbi:MAG: UDP-N-acetylenolpyruvoylglucosamine reductase [Candidatus Moranbacteria bacterium CG23_combo_of_CG06-09_8_20_14_all_35_22]|nr:MAG: UDP-N-acetylenolpyruvoylglucosamine reductase [Candidatus Moranbacteria bacterium CG23_combo_of_CG06-09_8_20_14_all_35_22]
MLKIQKNISLAPLTTFKIGGLAKHFVEVSSENEILEALDFAKENNLEIFVLGGGSNILVSDDGFNGLVIRMLNTSCIIHNTSIECGSGVLLSQIVKESAKNGLSGLEWASGIPGTVGGAIRGNAGIPLGCMADNIECVKILESQKSKVKSQNYNLKIKTLKKEECKFGYRSSIFKENKDFIIISAVLKLEKGDQEEISKKIKELIENRLKVVHPNPKEPSSGSFFKNPKVDNLELIANFEKDTGQKAIDGKIPAGWLIDEVGLRGKKIGGAQVSEKHANFVVNIGNAKAQDIVMLSSLIKMKVRDELGVQLSEEIKYVGF